MSNMVNEAMVINKSFLMVLQFLSKLEYSDCVFALGEKPANKFWKSYLEYGAFPAWVNLGTVKQLKMIGYMMELNKDYSNDEIPF